MILMNSFLIICISNIKPRLCSCAYYVLMCVCVCVCGWMCVCICVCVQMCVYELMGILARAILRVKQVMMLGKQNRGENEEVNPLLKGLSHTHTHTHTHTQRLPHEHTHI